MAPLRIAFDASRMRAFGVSTYIRNLLAALAQVDRDNEYTIVREEPSTLELPPLGGNFRVLSFPARRRELLNALSRSRFLRSLKADLYHVPLNRVPLFMPKPCVVTVHDMSELLFADQRQGYRSELRLKWLRHGLLGADKVIAVSSATAHDVMNTLGIPERRVRMIHNAPDPVFTEQISGNEIEERFRVMERYQVHYPFLLFAGKVVPQKNVPRLVEAFSVVRGELASHPQYKDLRLVIIGDEITSPVRQMVRRTRLENAVRFLGFVPINTLRAFYKAASAFVFPSLYEGFGLPPLEAMASGTPVVTSNLSSLPEVVGDAAVIVNPENVFDIARGMREILLDMDLRQRCVMRGIQQVRRFSWKRTAEQVLNVYNEVARGGNKGS